MKKSISLILVFLTFLGTVGSTSVFAEPVKTNRYYFYMPESWRNEYNSAYDGASLDSCRAGIYWWDGSSKPENWTGYVIADRETAESNIFRADVPADVTKIIFNNTVNAVVNPELRDYAYQTSDICSENYAPGDDDYGFYPDGIKNFNNMIYVVDPDFESTTSELPKTNIRRGEWFYYYGDGAYGIYPKKAQAAAAGAVLSGGRFPKNISSWKVTGVKNMTYTGKAITQKITVSNGSEKATVKASYSNNKNAGIATVTIKGTGIYTGSIVKTFEIKKADNPIAVKISSKTVKYSTVKKKSATVTAVTVTKAQGAVSYKKTSGNSKISVNSKSGKLTVKKGIKKGTYKVKVKIIAKGSKNYKSADVTKTVTVKVK